MTEYFIATTNTRPTIIYCQIMQSQFYMMTSSNGHNLRVTGPLCGEFTGPGEFPAQRPVTRSFDVFFDLHLYKRLSKQPWGWWFETPSWSLWCQCNDSFHRYILSILLVVHIEAKAHAVIIDDMLVFVLLGQLYAFRILCKYCVMNAVGVLMQ